MGAPNFPAKGRLFGLEPARKLGITEKGAGKTAPLSGHRVPLDESDGNGPVAGITEYSQPP
jgi:hypothetical protein